ncbi:MAG TPA: hypothetical protein VN677_16180 [Gemmatimonadaceae bacterium]|nr:hypothetical protein [Gemmatimonadaceae bacterium]
MLAVYCSAEAQLTRTLAAVPPHCHVSSSQSWTQFQRDVLGAPCAVVVLPWLTGEPFRRLRELKERCPTRPVVLVTTKDADNARCLRGVPVEEVVWLGDVSRELWPAIRRATFRPSLTDLAGEMEAAAHVPDRLRDALSVACRSESPVRSVGELAQLANCRRGTLWYQWKRVMRAEDDPRLEDFLGWLLVVRAIGLKDRTAAWTDVADGIGVHGRTLGRLARRLTGHTLEELWTGGETQALALFRERMMVPVISCATGHSVHDMDKLPLRSASQNPNILLTS